MLVPLHDNVKFRCLNKHPQNLLLLRSAQTGLHGVYIHWNLLEYRMETFYTVLDLNV